MKFKRFEFYSLTFASPLAEGRELKFVPIFSSAEEAVSPLAEGRELKFISPIKILFVESRPSRRGVN